MIDTIVRVILIIIGICILIALAEEYIKKPDSRVIYYWVGFCILIGLLVKMCGN